MGRTLRLLLCAGGVFIPFFLFGLVQEKITKSKYVNPDGSVEQFTYSMSLVFFYCTVNYVLTRIILLFMKEEDSTPKKYYWTLSLTYALAMISSITALQFVSYPIQTIGKSCKPIPIMIFGVLLGKRKYSVKKYFFVGMIVMGVIMFLYKDGKNKKSESTYSLGIGEILILCSLFMDGIIAAIQERIRSDHQGKHLTMMSEMNKWASFFLIILLITTNEAFKFISFLQRQPSVLWKLMALSFFGFIGQFFVLLTVTEFGTLPASLITTVRKFFTVLVSVLVLGNALLPRQWAAAVIIFSGLFLDILYGKSDSKVK